MTHTSTIDARRPAAIQAAAGLLYAGMAYVLFLVSFTAFGAAVTGLWTPWATDAGRSLPAALAIDVALILSFAVQHTIMARARFKAWWTRIVPAHLERSTFVLITSLLMFAIVFWWQPVPGALWSIASPLWRGIAHAGFAIGYLGVVASSFLIDHFHLFGLKQPWRHARGQAQLEPFFHEPWAYRQVRHPMMTSILVMMWSAADMSASQALMAGLFTLYIFAGVVFEERGLREELGDDYGQYRERVRWKVIPGVH